MVTKFRILALSCALSLPGLASGVALAQLGSTTDPSGSAAVSGMASPANVMDIQRRLNALGYNAGPEDGVLGPQTTQALRQFQQDSALPETTITAGGPIDQTLVDQLHSRTAGMAAGSTTGGSVTGGPVLGGPVTGDSTGTSTGMSAGEIDARTGTEMGGFGTMGQGRTGSGTDTNTIPDRPQIGGDSDQGSSGTGTSGGDTGSGSTSGGSSSGSGGSSSGGSSGGTGGSGSGGSSGSGG